MPHETHNDNITTVEITDDYDDSDNGFDEAPDLEGSVSPFTVSPTEATGIRAKARMDADRMKEKRTTAEKTLKETLAARDELNGELIKARHELALARKLARVRRTPQAELDKLEESVAVIELEMEALDEAQATAERTIEKYRETQNRALLLADSTFDGFSLGTTIPSLTIQLISGLRRNLAYRQLYLEDTISDLSTKIRDRMERVQYAQGISGLETERERDQTRLGELEAELSEVYTLQEATGIIYTKVVQLIPEQQSRLLEYNPKDPISVSALRREKLDRAMIQAEVQAEIAARKAAERVEAQGRQQRYRAAR